MTAHESRLDRSRVWLDGNEPAALAPSLGETAGRICPRCVGTGYIHDLRSQLALLRLIEEEGSKDKTGEVRAGAG